MTGPSATSVPAGTVVILERRARVLDDGAVLLGGAPPRMLHLSAAAQSRLVDGAVTVTDATS
ncbi:MAG TPA: mycofactocin system glycosyltransferase, partial [Pseudonocardia sp.]